MIVGRQIGLQGKRTTRWKVELLLSRTANLKQDLTAEMDMAAQAEEELERARLTKEVARLEVRVSEQQNNAILQSANFDKLSNRFMISKRSNDQLTQAAAEHFKNEIASERVIKNLSADLAISSSRNNELSITLRSLEDSHSSIWKQREGSNAELRSVRGQNEILTNNNRNLRNAKVELIEKCSALERAAAKDKN